MDFELPSHGNMYCDFDYEMIPEFKLDYYKE